MADRSSLLASFALVAAAGALAFSFLRGADPGGPPPAEDPSAALGELRAEVEALRRRVEAPAPVAAAVPAPRDGERTGAPGGSAERTGADLAELPARVARLEQRLQAVEGRPASAQPRPVDPKEQALRDADVPTLQAWFADPRRSEEERLQALRTLRFRGKDARKGDAALAAIRLVQTSQDPAVRADVWRQMSGAGDEAIVPFLIQSLQSDPDRKVREEAAETLGDFRTRADAEAALRAAMEHDADEGVRREAAQKLAARGRG